MVPSDLLLARPESKFKHGPCVTARAQIGLALTTAMLVEERV